MPHLARHDQDLLDEVGRHLGIAESLIASPTLGNLIQAQGRIDTAVSVLSDALAITQPAWGSAQGRCTGVLVDWEKACRTAGVRSELLSAVAPSGGTTSIPTLWVINGFGNQPLGDIALVSFSAAWPAPDPGKGSRAHHCLWGPGWLLPQLFKNDLVRAATWWGLPATRAEAEIAATLIEPDNPESPYRDIRAAHQAAQAVLAA